MTTRVSFFCIFWQWADLCYFVSVIALNWLLRLIAFLFKLYILFVEFQQRDATYAPSPFQGGSSALEQAFGLYGAAFCATAQLLPNTDSVRASPPASDGSGSFFEKLDSRTQTDSAASLPPYKRSRHCQHTAPDLRGPHLWPCQPSRGLFEGADVQSKQTSAQKGERSSSEEQGILPQHHNSALCVCWSWHTSLRPEGYSALFAHVSGVPRAYS